MKHLMLASAIGAATLLTACGSNGSTTATNTTATAIPSSKHPVYDQTEPMWNEEIAEARKQRFNATELGKPTVTINGKPGSEVIDITKLPNGLNRLNVELKIPATIDGKQHTIELLDTATIYKQDHSAVVGNFFVQGSSTAGVRQYEDERTSFFLKGNPTPLEIGAIPVAGVGKYVGESFTLNKNGSADTYSPDKFRTGTFEYTVDFGRKRGSGSLAIDGKNIRLNEGLIFQAADPFYRGLAIDGQTDDRIPYRVGFFGPKGEELVGNITDGSYAFAGKRTELKK